MKYINMDKAATTAVHPKVLEETLPYFNKIYGNPSSNYLLGRLCKNKIEETRIVVGNYINGDESNVYFTSSASESNNWAIKSFIKNNSGDIVVSPVEHKDILKCSETEVLNTGKTNYICKVDQDGKIDVEALKLLCGFIHTSSLVVIQMVNNETGVIQDIEEISRIVKSYGHYLMVDATQAITHINVDIHKLGIDILTFAGHKIGAMRGVGVLYTTLPLSNMIYGSQELGLRGSTENTPAIISLREALKLDRYEETRHIYSLQCYFINQIKSNISDSYIISENVARVNHIVNVCFKGCSSTQIQTMLDIDGIFVSTGSACNSYNPEPSHVLSAMKVVDEDIHCCVRFSFDGNNTIEEIDYVINKVKNAVDILRG